MKKIFKALLCTGLAGMLAVGTIGAAACKKSGKRNPESSPLRLAIGACDEKFNPMFYTSQNDGTIAGLTQVSLITSDSDGNLAVGENQPTVALDYLETYYNKAGAVIGTGDGTNTDFGENSADIEGSTKYEFLIKNGMKFSDGEPLTVMDVLFNLYVYLDPLYNGSSTIYSTKIKGLQAYRQNKEGVGEDSELSTTTYYADAQKRITNLIRWSNGTTTGELSEEGEKDLAKVKELYKEELTTDWNGIATSWGETYKDYYFDTTWKAYFFMEEIFKEQTKPNDNNVEVHFKDENGKYPTEIDPDVNTNQISVRGAGLIAAAEEALTDAKINEYIAQHPGTSRENAKLTLEKEFSINYIYNSTTGDSNIWKILTTRSTASTALEAFIQDEQTKETETEEQVVKRIDGIKVNRTKEFNGKTYDEEHDILSIEIVGIDPKAKWNFGFAVAPMHYYSGTYGGVNYVKEAMDVYNDGSIYNNDDASAHFGVKYKDSGFITGVLSAGEKNGVPVGAGPYMCCTYNYSTSGVSRGTFFYNYMAFFQRNPYFETMGAGINNAKIKFVTYKVTNDDKIVSSLKTGEIDYGEPTAKSDNQTALNGSEFTQLTYLAGGYGYVGINPKYVEDITIRRAIMKAFDTSAISEYYGEALVNIICRPMSTTSWVWDSAYGHRAKLEDPYYAPSESAEDLINFIESDSGGAWEHRNDGWYKNGAKQSLKYNFVIAGESVDHPAYDMFTYAKTFLEEAGFSITVGNDPQALTKLVSGNLEVWAAAWSSSIDPDPYQIYSINSRASSTKNWNKDNIINNPDKFPVEYELAQQLNDKIIEGRQTLDKRQRSNIYAGDDGALDLIMEMAVEFPTYQRNDLCVFRNSVLDRNTMTEEPSFNMGPISELWKVNYVL
ncbi:MAG: ABC transporter substrate-binding protein [Roseburia sp.]|nr:ABC transporter substrate-binding protein [Roseburia sp.]